MTKQHLAAPSLFCLRLGAKRNHLQQSHAGLSVLAAFSMTGNKHLFPVIENKHLAAEAA